MTGTIGVDTIVRLRHDHNVIGICGLPEEALGLWIPLYDLEVVPWEELADVPMVMVA